MKMHSFGVNMLTTTDVLASSHRFNWLNQTQGLANAAKAIGKRESVRI